MGPMLTWWGSKCWQAPKQQAQPCARSEKPFSLHQESTCYLPADAPRSGEMEHKADAERRYRKKNKKETRCPNCMPCSQNLPAPTGMAHPSSPGMRARRPVCRVLPWCQLVNVIHRQPATFRHTRREPPSCSTLQLLPAAA